MMPGVPDDEGRPPMMRELLEKEVSAAKHAVDAVRDWLHHPTTVMKEHTFDRALDDLGQSIEDVERRADAPGPPRGTRQ
jgi:hypothetical protein